MKSNTCIAVTIGFSNDESELELESHINDLKKSIVKTIICESGDDLEDSAELFLLTKEYMALSFIPGISYSPIAEVIFSVEDFLMTFELSTGIAKGSAIFNKINEDPSGLFLDLQLNKENKIYDKLANFIQHATKSTRQIYEDHRL